jgi:nicotinamidase-related amidase
MTGRTARLPIGHQNDRFADDGILRGFLEDTEQQSQLIRRTTELVQELAPSDVLIIATPFYFTADYSELVNPTGILATIRDVGAFKADTPGSETVPEFAAFGDRIKHIPGKPGLKAFSNTQIQEHLEDANVTRLVLDGAVASVCIDSTASILSGCIVGRTEYEQKYYCENIFTLYADVLTSEQLIENRAIAGA